MDYSAAHELARSIRQSDEYINYSNLKANVMSDSTVAALITEYKKLQVSIQIAVMNGQNAPGEDMQRFSGITSLLFSKPEVSQYLMAEMQLQQAVADIFKIISDAADLDLGIPGMG